MSAVRISRIATIVTVLALLTGCGSIYTTSAERASGVSGFLVAGPTSSGAYAVRLNSDGSRDTDFGLSLDNVIVDVERLDGDRLLIGGQFTSVNGNPVTGLAAVDVESGQLLPSHGVDLRDSVSNPASVSAIAVLPDGSAIVGGNFATVNGSAETPGLVRIFGDGTVDTGFAFGVFPVGASTVRAVRYAHGRVFVSGEFASVGRNSSTQIQAERFFSFRPGDGLADISPPGTGEGPDQPVHNFTWLPGDLVGAFGSFAVTFVPPGESSAVNRSYGILIDGQQPLGDLSVNLIQNASGAFWNGTKLPDGRLLVTGPIDPGGDAASANGHYALYDRYYLPTFEAPVSMDLPPEGVLSLASDSVYMYGFFTSIVDAGGATAPPFLFKMDTNFFHDPGFQPDLPTDATAAPVLFPLF